MKNKTIQGLGNKKIIVISKHDSLKYWRPKSNINSRMSIKYMLINHSHYLDYLDNFRFVGRQMVSPKKVHMQTRLNFIDYRKFHNPLSNSCQRCGKRHA
jgi:hypothetical protein